MRGLGATTHTLKRLHPGSSQPLYSLMFDNVIVVIVVSDGDGKFYRESTVASTLIEQEPGRHSGRHSRRQIAQLDMCESKRVPC